MTSAAAARAPAVPAEPPRAAEPPIGAVALHGVGAGVIAALVAIFWVGFCGEVANQPTLVPGIWSSSWTGVTSITAFLFGRGAFHGSFHVGSIAFGLATVIVLGGALGAIGAACIHATVGAAASGPVAVLVGVAYGFIVQIGLLNLAVNAIQGPNDVYHSIPPWGWWVASAGYGVVLALLVTRRWRRSPLHTG